MSRTRRPKARRVGPAGLSVVRGPRKDGRWYWRARVLGVTAWTGWATPREAEEATIQTLAEGTWAEPAREAPVVHTVEDLLDYWVGYQERRVGIAPRTLENYKSRSRQIRKVLGAYPARRLGFALGELYRDTLLGRGHSSATVALDLRIIRMAARWGQAMELGEIGVVPRIQLPVVERLKRTPTTDEVLRVLEELEGWPKLATWLLFRTGARPVAIRRLVWGDVDLERGLLSIRQTKRNPRYVPIVDVELLEELGRLKGASDDPVLGVTERKAKQLPDHLTRACKRAGVERFAPYGLRRLAVDTLYRVTDPGTAAAVLGHSPATALRFYRQVSELEARAALVKALGAGGEVHEFKRKGGDQ